MAGGFMRYFYLIPFKEDRPAAIGEAVSLYLMAEVNKVHHPLSVSAIISRNLSAVVLKHFLDCLPCGQTQRLLRNNDRSMICHAHKENLIICDDKYFITIRGSVIVCDIRHCNRRQNRCET